MATIQIPANGRAQRPSILAPLAVDGALGYAANAASLQRYLETEICPWYETRRKELENRPLIHAQAFGEALDPDRLQGLARYEVHLDRKLERTLTMLIRLQDLRRGSSET